VRISELTGDATRLIDMWAGVDHVVLVDAMRSGRAPGTIVRLELIGGAGGDAGLEASTALRSSHALGVLDALALSRQFGTLPKLLVAYGVEGEDFALGGLLSRGVSAVVPDVTSRVLAEVEAATSPSESR
jgi:hydrogenase maturation protease